MKIINVNQNLPFAKGWTVNKLLKGGGVAVDPSEISGLEVLADIVTDEDEDYVDFTGLDINTDKTYRLLLAIQDASVSGGEFYLLINGIDTATFYYTQVLYANHTTVGAFRANNNAFTSIDAGGDSISVVNIIKDVSGYFRASISNNRRVYDLLVTENRVICSTFVADNITSIRIVANSSGGLGEGSRLLLTKQRTG